MRQVDDDALVGHDVVEQHPDHLVELDQRRRRIMVVVLGDVVELSVEGERQQAAGKVGEEQVQAFRVQARVGQQVGQLRVGAVDGVEQPEQGDIAGTEFGNLVGTFATTS
ncbi:hypothetical protein D3C84_983300 [compost metagenome]